MRRQSLLSSLIFTSALAANSAAADQSCEIRVVARCSCPASMQLGCDSGKSGFVDDEERPRSITLSMYDPETKEQREVILVDPPAGIRSYYGNLEEDPWIGERLAAKGISRDSRIRLYLASARFADDLKLYADPDKQEFMGEIQKQKPGW